MEISVGFLNVCVGVFECEKEVTNQQNYICWKNYILGSKHTVKITCCPTLLTLDWYLALSITALVLRFCVKHILCFYLESTHLQPLKEVKRLLQLNSLFSDLCVSLE